MDIKELQSLLLIAEERKQAQEAWYALSIKIPDHAPWAPHGYARLVEHHAITDSLMRIYDSISTTDKQSSQAKEDSSQLSSDALQCAIINLNATINTMRPGNLAEPEDLTELLFLITQAKRYASNHSSNLQKAIEYAEMVVRYVSDGSGTHDMIQKATALLSSEL